MEDAVMQFQEIAKIDSREIAEYYLNVSNGDVQAALSMLFEDKPVPEEVPQTAEQTLHADPLPGSDPEITILEWNIQGLLPDFLKERTVAIVDIIRQHKPTVIMLQEVVLETYLYLKSTLKPDYVAFSPAESSVACAQYFTAIFADKAIFKSPVAKVTPFPNSRQGRQILIVEGRCYNCDVTVMTSHLESTKAGEAERKRQLALLYLTMTEVHPSRTVVFGGDTNLRDYEFNSVVSYGKFDTKQVNDIWSMLGSPQDARYSWDLHANDNQISGGKARLRFERMYTRVENDAAKSYFRPRSMKFVGMDRLPCGKFPSDHWGIFARFSL